MSTNLINRMLDARRLNSTHLAIAALIAYDHVLTLPDEVRLIWSAKWNVGKVLFFLTRYLIVLEMVIILLETLKFHEQLYHARLWISFAGIVVAEIIMVVRVYAIWGAKRRVLVFLVILSLGILIFGVFQYAGRVRSPDNPKGLSQPYVDYILIMASELVIATMTFWKWFSEWRQCESSLAKTIFEDSLRYFVCLFAISSANVLAATIVGGVLADSLYVIQRALHSILSARILLSTREGAYLENNHGISDSSLIGNPNNYAADITLSRIDFTEQTDSDTYETAGTRTRTTGSGSVFPKGEKAGPVHHAERTVGNKELYQVVHRTEVTDKHVCK